MDVLVDPPEGWKYGFPAPLQSNYRQQLINAGYPENMIEMALRHSRYIGDSPAEIERAMNRENK